MAGSPLNPYIQEWPGGDGRCCRLDLIARSIIPDIDGVLARHYGLTDEELDFIVNYDIKYRMGQNSLEDEEG